MFEWLTRMNAEWVTKVARPFITTVGAAELLVIWIIVWTIIIASLINLHKIQNGNRPITDDGDALMAIIVGYFVGGIIMFIILTGVLYSFVFSVAGVVGILLLICIFMGTDRIAKTFITDNDA